MTAEQQLADLRASIAALADSWIAWDRYARTNYDEETDGPRYAAAMRLALLDDPTTGEAS